MKIGVCVKQVPAKDAPLAIAEGGAWIRESDIGFETNEPDSFALEESLRLKEKHSGEVVAISMGPDRAKQTIKEALAKGEMCIRDRDVTLGEADGVSILAPHGDLFAHEGDRRLVAFVVLNDQLHLASSHLNPGCRGCFHNRAGLYQRMALVQVVAPRLSQRNSRDF